MLLYNVHRALASFIFVVGIRSARYRRYVREGRSFNWICPKCINEGKVVQSTVPVVSSLKSTSIGEGSLVVSPALPGLILSEDESSAIGLPLFNSTRRSATIVPPLSDDFSVLQDDVSCEVLSPNFLL